MPVPPVSPVKAFLETVAPVRAAIVAFPSDCAPLTPYWVAGKMLSIITQPDGFDGSATANGVPETTATVSWIGPQSVEKYAP
jgi:hypothetical protein